jgi:hypothetical protein
MRVYTKREVEAIFLRGYHMGVETGRLPRDRQAGMALPTLEEAEIYHPLTSSDDPANMARKRPWLEAVGPQTPAVGHSYNEPGAPRQEEPR